MSYTPAIYRELRRRRGTQQEVAAQLGVHVITVSKRERGLQTITHEAWLALRQIPVKPEPLPSHGKINIDMLP